MTDVIKQHGRLSFSFFFHLPSSSLPHPHPPPTMASLSDFVDFSQKSLQGMSSLLA